MSWTGCKGNHKSASFKSLIVAQSLQECNITFGLLFSWVESIVVSSTWYVVPLIALFTGEGTNKGILSVPEFIYFNQESLNRGNNHKIYLENPRALCEMTRAKIPLVIWLLTPYSDWWITVMFCWREIMSVYSQCPVFPENHLIFFAQM